MLILTPTDFSLSLPTPTSVLDWVSSPNGQQAGEHGSSAASLLPADDDVVLVLPPRAVSWHQTALPKVAGGRLRAALDGLLEDRLLDDTTELHLALEPGGKPGQTLWVAACDKPWLKAWLEVLDSAGRPVSRIVPAIAPLRAGQPPPPNTGRTHRQGVAGWPAPLRRASPSCRCRSTGPWACPTVRTMPAG